MTTTNAIAGITLLAILTACGGGGGGGGGGQATKAFTDSVADVVTQTSDDTEPVAVDTVAVDQADDAEPVAVM